MLFGKFGKNLSGRISRGASIAGTILIIIIGSATKAVFFDSGEKAEQKHTEAVTSGATMKTFETGEFSIELPDVFKEVDLPVVSVGAESTETLATYGANDITVTVSRVHYTVDSQSYINSNSIEKYAQLVAESMKDYSSDITTTISSTRYSGNCVLMEMNVNKSGLFKGTDQVYMRGKLWFANDYTYEVDICCTQEDRPKYKSSMELWAKSFTVK